MIEIKYERRESGLYVDVRLYNDKSGWRGRPKVEGKGEG